MQPSPTENQQVSTDYDEINLRELIDVLLTGKWLIMGITVCAVLVAGLISFFVLTPSYRASTVLLVRVPQAFQQAPQDTPLSELLDIVGRPAVMTLETYRLQATNPVILTNVIEELNLDPAKYTVEGMQNSVDAELLQGTDLLQISATGTDPLQIKQIANAVAGEFVEFINYTGREQLARSLRFVEEQIGIEEAKLFEAVQAYKEFLAQPRCVRELAQEVDVKLAILTDFKAETIRNSVEIESTQHHLAEAERQLAGTPMTLETQRSIMADPALLVVAQETTGAGLEELIALQTTDEQLNPLHLRLMSEIATGKLRLVKLGSRQDLVQEQMVIIGSQLEELQVELAEKQVEEEKLSQKVAILRSHHRTFVDRYEESRVSELLEMGEFNITVLSPAREPVLPVGPRKMLNVAIAGVLGVMISIFLVFFLEFWRKSEN